MAHHDSSCGDQVVGVALSPKDHEELRIAELWGARVFGDPKVEQGRVEVLCESNCVLIPPFDTVEEIREEWKFRPRPPASEPV